MKSTLSLIFSALGVVLYAVTSIVRIFTYVNPAVYLSVSLTAICLLVVGVVLKYKK